MLQHLGSDRRSCVETDEAICSVRHDWTWKFPSLSKMKFHVNCEISAIDNLHTVHLSTNSTPCHLHMVRYWSCSVEDLKLRMMKVQYGHLWHWDIDQGHCEQPQLDLVVMHEQNCLNFKRCTGLEWLRIFWLNILYVLANSNLQCWRKSQARKY